jgi:rhomboid protease GluP
MDLELPLLVLAVMSAVALAVRALRVRPLAADWAIVAAIVLAVAGVGYASFRDHVGVVSFAVWFTLGWAPMLLSRAAVAASLRTRGRLAEACAWAMYALHPTAAYRLQARRLRVIALEQAGDVEQALDEIARLIAESKVSVSEPFLWERLMALRTAERWDDLDDLLQSIPDGVLLRDPSLAIVGAALRARARPPHARPGAVWARQRARGRRARPHDLACVAILAYAGRREQVDLFFGAQLRAAGPELRRLWQLTADLAAGRAETRQELERIAVGPRGLARAARARLLFEDRAAADPLDPAQQDLVDALARILEAERRYRFGASRPTRPYATWALAALLLAVFGVETALGGSTDEVVLDRLGALVAWSVVERGEVHRLFTFLFLHYGFVHLTFNTLGLLVIAPFVENSLGRARFLVTYFVSGLAGGLLAIARDTWLPSEPSALVGASGCIMGLVGASCAILLRGYREDRSILAKRRFLLLLLLLALQTVFDVVVPNVSQLAHVTGAVAGFLVTLVIGGRRAR